MFVLTLKNPPKNVHGFQFRRLRLSGTGRPTDKAYEVFPLTLVKKVYHRAGGPAP